MSTDSGSFISSSGDPSRSSVSAVTLGSSPLIWLLPRGMCLPCFRCCFLLCLHHFDLMIIARASRCWSIELELLSALFFSRNTISLSQSLCKSIDDSLPWCHYVNKFNLFWRCIIRWFFLYKVSRVRFLGRKQAHPNIRKSHGRRNHQQPKSCIENLTSSFSRSHLWSAFIGADDIRRSSSTRYG